MAAAVLLGFALAEVGVSIQHDANHGAYMPRTWWSALMAATLDAVRQHYATATLLLWLPCSV